MNEDRIDEMVLALLYLGAHADDHPDFVRAWKGFDWNAMNRLHEKGLISNPVGKAKSVVFTKDGWAESQRLFELHFGESDEESQ